jgi:CARDB
MLRRAPTALLAAAALAAAVPGSSLAAAPAAAVPGSSLAAAPSASVKLAKCSLRAHEAVFRGRMKRLPDTARMGMRFVLLERRGTRGFEAVRAPGLRRWQRSRPGVHAFAYRQTVRNLASNAVYRVRVDFRWYEADGDVTAHLSRRSPPCRQFVTLPNLVTDVVGIFKTKVAGVLRYSVRVRNVGRAAARGVPVRVVLDGDVLDTVTVTTLAPGESKILGFRGPACSRSLRAIADPDGLITEGSETDNASESSCISPTRR